MFCATIPVRLMARLDIKGPNLVKGIHLEGLRVLGKPESAARYYYENGADELIYMDVVASLYGRNSLADIIRRTSREVFIPLTVGGGLRTLDDIRAVLKAGADKVALNTAAIANPQLVKDAARRFGSSTIVGSIEALRNADGTWEAYTDSGRQKTGVSVFPWAKQLVALGAGEIMITSIDQEGTGKGFDVDLTRSLAEALPVPVIACGGAGRIAPVRDAVVDGKADAVALASIVHYHFIKQVPREGDYRGEGNIEYLKQSSRGFSCIQDTTFGAIKANLIEQGILCRPAAFSTAGQG